MMVSDETLAKEMGWDVEYLRKRAKDADQSVWEFYEEWYEIQCNGY